MARFDLSLSSSTLLVSLAAIVAIYTARTFVTWWLRPYRTPLTKLQGPPLKHWFFGFETPLEKKDSRLTQKAVAYRKSM
jgi:hypothetical protein